ncbi:hypothetical protein ABZ578_20140, partial [Streptomyces sp. NPDC013489]
MIEVPAGRVTLSDRRTQRSWAVDVGAFALGAAPVTRGLYEQVTGTAPSAAHGDRRPVEGVSWDDAIRFCDALSLAGRRAGNVGKVHGRTDATLPGGRDGS